MVPLGVGIGAAMVAIAVGFALASYLLGRAGRHPIRTARAKRRADAGRCEESVDRADDSDGPPDDAVDELDPTTETVVDATIPLAIDPYQTGTDPSPAPWWPDPAVPRVTSVEGVEVDEP